MEAAPAEIEHEAPAEMGPTISKEMLESRRAESIRTVFHLTGLLLLRAADPNPSPEMTASVVTIGQQAMEIIPSFQHILRTNGIESLEPLIGDAETVVNVVSDILSCVTAAAPPSENSNVIALRKKLAGLCPRPDDSDELGMDRLRKFAAFLQEWRSSHLSQMQFLDLMHANCPVKYTQTCLSRFEKGNLSYQSMRRMHGYIEKTMLAFAENPFAAPASVRKRKQRETISIQVRQALEQQFQHTPRPSLEALQAIARDLNLSLETTRYWFQNARSSVKKVRSDGTPLEIGCRPEPAPEDTNQDAV